MFAAELEALGIWWPEGDGDALRVSADGWTAAADLIEDIGRVLDVAASMVTEHHRGIAAEAFAALWANWTGPAGYLAVTVADCRRIAAALTDFGTDIDVADRALVRLIEEALDAQIAPTLLLLDELWCAWLTDGATAIGAELASRADTACASLPDAALGPILSADERAALDPARVSWPDLSTPADLTHLATDLVDLGAGQGDLPIDGTVPVPPPTDGGTVPVPGDVAPPTPSFPTFPASGGVTIVVNGDGNTITVETPSYTAPSYTPPVYDDVFEPAPLPEFGADQGLDAFAAVEPTGFDPSPGVFDVPPVASAPARLAELDRRGVTDSFRNDAGPLPATPIVIDPPGSAAAVAAGAVAGTAAAAARSGRAPFMPFMPMGGAMSGGDESPEPKRRVTRKRRLGG